MEFKKRRALNILWISIGALSLTWCVYRDLQLRKEYPGDLRNRIVGSRLQRDGISPYFYHWKETDGIRYYDWNNGTTHLTASNITASPFFHQLLTPIAGFDQYTISIIWMTWNYLALLMMVIMALKRSSTQNQKIAVIVVSLLFLHSYAWTNHLINGQMYLSVALLAMGFYYFISRKPADVNAVVAGFLAASLFLIRSTTLIYLLPFLLLAGRYPLRYKLILVMSMLIVFSLEFSSARSRHYWKDYQLAIGEHLKGHQNLGPATQDTVHVPVLERWEGWNYTSIIRAQGFPYYKRNDANGNVFVFINKTLDVKTPIWLLAALCVASMALITLFFLRQHWGEASLNMFSVTLLAYLLYMASDMFSPIHRFHYNASQWAFPLLLAGSNWSQKTGNKITIGVLTGLILNCLPFSMFRMQQTIGEYIIYLSLLALLLCYKTDRLT